MIDPKALGAALKRARRAAFPRGGVDLASRSVGVSARMLEHYEAGTKMPSVQKLAELCASYHVSADAVLGLVECACGLTYKREEYEWHRTKCEDVAA